MPAPLPTPFCSTQTKPTPFAFSSHTLRMEHRCFAFRYLCYILFYLFSCSSVFHFFFFFCFFFIFIFPLFIVGSQWKPLAQSGKWQEYHILYSQLFGYRRYYFYFVFFYIPLSLYLSLSLFLSHSHSIFLFLVSFLKEPLLAATGMKMNSRQFRDKWENKNDMIYISDDKVWLSSQFLFLQFVLSDYVISCACIYVCVLCVFVFVSVPLVGWHISTTNTVFL